MKKITFENAQDFYNEVFYEKTSGTTTGIIGKGVTNDGEQVLLLANRHFVTIPGFNRQYMLNSEHKAFCRYQEAIEAKYISEIKRIGEILDGSSLSRGITFKANGKYYRIHMYAASRSFELTVRPYKYSKKVVRSWAEGVLRHLAYSVVDDFRKNLHEKDFGKVIGECKNETDFANKFFAKLGFLGCV